ncbi:MAG: DUF4177 domain-containing protein [Desulfobulbus sp.]
MVWQYRTILFEFTKDGLLGDRYVDDEEMEKTLNQMGRDSWELVGVSLLQDGLLTFLKRPAGEEGVDSGPRVRDADNHPSPQRPVEPAVVSRDTPSMSRENRVTEDRPPIGGRNPVINEPVFHENPGPGRSFERPVRNRQEQEDNDFVGGIRIS